MIGRQKPIQEVIPGSDARRLYIPWKSILTESAPSMLMALESGDVDFVCTDMPTAQAAVIVYPDMKDTLTMCITPTASPRMSRKLKLSVPDVIMEQTFSYDAKPAPTPTAAENNLSSSGANMRK